MSPTGINNSQIVGNILGSNTFSKPQIWQSGVLTPLQGLQSGNGLSDYAFAINDAGQIVGRAGPVNLDGSNYHAVIWASGQAAVRLLR